MVPACYLLIQGSLSEAFALMQSSDTELTLKLCINLTVLLLLALESCCRIFRNVATASAFFHVLLLIMGKHCLCFLAQIPELMHEWH